MRLISIYGYDAFKFGFINELHNLLSGWSGPTLVGGDFNLIREVSEKSTGLINQHWVNLFSDWVNKFGLIELISVGRKFSWGNNEDSLVMATLDRVFMYTDWDNLLHVFHLKALPRIGSDHTPMIVDTCAIPILKVKMFRFEKCAYVWRALKR